MSDSSLESGEVRPSGEPPAVPDELQCDDESNERADLLGSEPQWGDGSKFKLRIEDLSYDYGDTATIALTHSGETGKISTGSEMKYAIECYTKAGWQDIRTVGDMIYIAPPDIEVEHQSNPLFE
ncbi:hypothetical protein [Halovenus marina]|uniref:hypothetical protein n=1 Tax=Halovenus marina TaxID=3396621 RepID=UPI003F54F477